MANSRAAQIGHQTTQCRLVPFLPARRVEEHDLPAGQSCQGHLIGLRLKIIEVPYHPLMPDRLKDIPPRETAEALASLPWTSVILPLPSWSDRLRSLLDLSIKLHGAVRVPHARQHKALRSRMGIESLFRVHSHPSSQQLRFASPTLSLPAG